MKTLIASFAVVSLATVAAIAAIPATPHYVMAAPALTQEATPAEPPTPAAEQELGDKIDRLSTAIEQLLERIDDENAR